MSIMPLRHAPHTAGIALLLSLTTAGCEQLAGHRPTGTDIAHHAGSAEPAPSTVPVPLPASGPVTAGAAAPAPARHLADAEKVAAGERAVRAVRVGETLRQTLGRRADRSDRTIFWLLREDAAGSRCVDWNSAVGGVYEGDFDSALSWVLCGYG